MKKTIFYLCVLTALFSLSTCQIDHEIDMPINKGQRKVIVGKGSVISKNIKLDNFISIDISGPSKISLNKGNESKMMIDEFENLIEHWEIKVENQILKIKVVDSIQLKNSLAFIDIQTMDNVISITINGSASMKINSGIENISSVKVNGGGVIEMNGKTNTNQCHIDIKGSGDINFSNILTKSASCNIDGSGSISASVQDSLAVTINGSGEVSYFGDPKIKSNITGSGKVIKL
jgi:hypothetical protein